MVVGAELLAGRVAAGVGELAVAAIAPIGRARRAIERIANDFVAFTVIRLLLEPAINLFTCRANWKVLWVTSGNPFLST